MGAGVNPKKSADGLRSGEGERKSGGAALPSLLIGRGGTADPATGMGTGAIAAIIGMPIQEFRDAARGLPPPTSRKSDLRDSGGGVSGLNRLLSTGRLAAAEVSRNFFLRSAGPLGAETSEMSCPLLMSLTDSSFFFAFLPVIAGFFGIADDEVDAD